MVCLLIGRFYIASILESVLAHPEIEVIFVKYNLNKGHSIHSGSIQFHPVIPFYTSTIPDSSVPLYESHVRLQLSWSMRILAIPWVRAIGDSSHFWPERAWEASTGRVSNEKIECQRKQVPLLWYTQLCCSCANHSKKSGHAPLFSRKTMKQIGISVFES